MGGEPPKKIKGGGGEKKPARIQGTFSRQH